MSDDDCKQWPHRTRRVFARTTRRTAGRPFSAQKVLLFIVTPSRYFLSHRLALARAAAQAGWEVHVATPQAPGDCRIREDGITVHHVELHRGIGSPCEEWASVRSLYGIFVRLRPLLVHAVAPKAAVVGGLMARVLGISAVVMKGGIGSTLTQPGLSNAVARLVIRYGIAAAVPRRSVLVVQNSHELNDLARSARVRERTVLIAGAGVDCSAFHPSPEPPPPVTVLLPARMLRSKGVPEFVKAARLLRERGVKARFVLAGDVDAQNASSLNEREIEAWVAEEMVDWLGYRDDMPAVLASSHIVCLPSHGEGLPKALSEACAAGKPIVATDVPGCREVVRNGVNGFLTPPGDIGALARALETLICDQALRANLGACGREIALAELDERVIIPQMLALYDRVVS